MSTPHLARHLMHYQPQPYPPCLSSPLSLTRPLPTSVTCCRSSRLLAPPAYVTGMGLCAPKNSTRSTYHDQAGRQE